MTASGRRWARLGSAVTVSTTLFASTLAPAQPAQDGVDCGFRITAVHILAELTGDNSARAEELRELLVDAGANEPGFVPASCYATGSTGSGSTSSAPDDADRPRNEPEPGSRSRDDERRPTDDSSSAPSDSAGSGTGSTSGAGPAAQLPTAAEAFGWGEPDFVDEFEGTGLEGWNAYDGPGHAGNGTRSPDAATVADGVLTIDGSADGTTAGLAWGNSQQYGRWEVAMRAPVGDPAYNALALLWPTAENFPVGGEVDFAEIMDSSREKVDLFLHYGADNSQVHGEVEVDATEWQVYAVEWTPEGITAFLNGEEWWKTTDTSILPPGPMHLCLQLDWFPDNGGGGTGQVQYDYVKQWTYGDGDGPSTDSEASEGSTDADSSTTLTEERNRGE